MLKVLIFVAIVASVLGDHSVMAFGEKLMSIGSTIMNALSRMYECVSGGSHDDDRTQLIAKSDQSHLTRVQSYSSSSRVSVVEPSSPVHDRPVSIAAPNDREFYLQKNLAKSSTTTLATISPSSSSPALSWLTETSSIKTSSFAPNPTQHSTSDISTNDLISHDVNTHEPRQEPKRSQSFWSKLISRDQKVQMPYEVSVKSLRTPENPHSPTNQKRSLLSKLLTRPSSTLPKLDVNNFTILGSIREEDDGVVYLATEHGEVYEMKAVNILDVHRNTASQDFIQTLNNLVQICDDAIRISESDFVLKMQFICTKGYWIFIIREFGIQGNVVQAVLRRRRKMGNDGLLTYQEARILLSEVFYGVHVLHTEYDIMHGNLKWEHIFLDEYGHVKIGVLDQAKQRSTFKIPKEKNRHTIDKDCSMFLDTCQLASMVSLLKIRDADPHILESLQELKAILISLSNHANPETVDFFPTVQGHRFLHGIDWHAVSLRRYDGINCGPANVRVDMSLSIDKIIGNSNNRMNNAARKRIQNQFYYVHPKHQGRYDSQPPNAA